MCGVAGYNVSPEFAAKWLDQDKMERVLQEAWYHNIHRGYQAAGFFYFNSKNELVVYKSPGQADHIFEADFRGKGNLEVASLFAAHTREPSVGRGKPENNENNHPVSWGGVCVTHNGNVANDLDIKKQFKGKKNKKMPAVDSVAIPMMLSLIDDPIAETAQLVSVMEEFEGDSTFHAVWEDYPHVSLLSRGAFKPLIVAQCEDAVVYGSEKESVWHMIKVMGIDPNKSWNFRSLDKGAFMLVDKGRPVDWGTFKVKEKKHWANNKADSYVKRYLPAEADGNGAKFERQLIYITDSNYDYVHELEEYSLKDAKNDDEDIVYERLSFKKGTFPVQGETDLEGVFSEADRIIKQGKYYHVFYGDVELVVTNGRVVRDVFNHALFDNEDRWVEMVKEDDKDDIVVDGIVEREIGGGVGWGDFFGIKHTTPITQLPFGVEPYKYLKTSKGGGSGKVQIKKKSSTLGGSDINGKGQDTSDGELGARKLMQPEIALGWTDELEEHGIRKINDHVTHHIHDEGLIFLHDPICSVHRQKFSQHEHPHDCNATLLAASYTFAAFTDLTLWYYLGSEMPKIEWFNLECDANGCQWVDSEYVKVYSAKAYWNVTTSQECWACGGVRRLETLPDWFEKLTVSKRIPILLDYYYA